MCFKKTKAIASDYESSKAHFQLLILFSASKNRFKHFVVKISKTKLFKILCSAYFNIFVILIFILYMCTHVIFLNVFPHYTTYKIKTS